MNPCSIEGKKVTLQQNFDRNAEGHMAVVDRGDSGPHFSPEELAIMVERWRDQHRNILIKCQIPGTIELISVKSCKGYRKGRREHLADEIAEAILDPCETCPHNTQQTYRELASKKGGRAAARKGHMNRIAYNLLDWLTVAQTASQLNCTVDTVYGMIDRGELEHRKAAKGFGKTPRLYVSERSVEKLLAKREQERLLNATV